MKKFCKFLILMSVLVIIIAGVPLGKAFADGDDVDGLGPPSIAIASGSGFVAGGTGMVSQTGTISLNVPGDVVQVLLYWVGRGTPDDTITVDATSITGTEIGFTDLLNDSTSFRADITGLDLVDSGANSLTIDDMDFSSTNDGVGLLVIYNTPSTLADIQIRDGNDFAYINLTGAAQVTIPQTFSFAAESSPRTATLTLFVGDGTSDRPDKMQITVNGTTTTFWNLFDGVPDGPEFDAINLPVSIPAGADELTVQLFSEDDPNGLTGIPDSLSWMAAALSVPVTELEGCTPGYWKQEQHFDSWMGYSPGDYFEHVFGRTITIKWSEKGKPKPLSNPTLLQALEANGGGINALARHSVAALLNAANSDVSYSYTEFEVIEMFQAAFDSSDFETTKDMFAEANEAGCPLNNAETEADNMANKKEKKKRKVKVILDPEDTDGIIGKVIIKDNGKVTKVKGVVKKMDPDATYQTLFYTGTGCVGDPVLIGNWKVKRSGKGKLKEIFRPGLELDDFMSVSVREVTLGAPLLKACGDF